MSDVIAIIHPSAPRRAVGSGLLAVLGLLLIYLALWEPPADLVWVVFLLVLGGGAIALAFRLWKASEVPLELTREELRERGGRRLALVADIREVTRGPFAFKPSNGFLLTLKVPGPRVWAPGLWWRLGRRVGIGGVTSGQEAKNMADILTLVLAERGQGPI
jgi:hypothetical protein